MRVVEQLAETPKLVNDLGARHRRKLSWRNLQLGNGHAEGQFFPDTYGYKKGTRILRLLLRAHERMHTVLDARMAESSTRACRMRRRDDALIMASIIEKETGRDVERGKISRVFVSRLQRAMRLQTDPTVIYGLGDAFDGNLTRAQLDSRQSIQHLSDGRSAADADRAAGACVHSSGAASGRRRLSVLCCARRRQQRIQLDAGSASRSSAPLPTRRGRVVTRGRFITFEGTEGVGKTTNMDFVASRIDAARH